MSTFSFRACRESFAKAQNSRADCFMSRSFQIACTAGFGSITFCGFAFSLLKLTKIIYYYQ